MKLKEDYKTLSDKRMHVEFNRFFEFTEKDLWLKKIENFKRQLSSAKTIFYRNHLAQRDPFVFAFNQFFELDKAGKVLYKNKTKELIAVSNILHILNRMFYELNNNAKKKILGSLASDSPLPFVFETQIAAGFLVNGLEVDFIDLERDDGQKSSYDFLINCDSVYAEVECKRIDYDTGRIIKRPEFLLLCDEVLNALNNLKTNCVIRITTEKTIGSNKDVHKQIAESLKDAVNNHKDSVQIGSLLCEIKYPDNLANIKSDYQARDILNQFWSENDHLAFISFAEYGILITAQSEKKNKLLEKTYYSLKHGARQLTGEKPSLLCCFIEGMKGDQWHALTGESGLNLMSKHFFEPDDIGHVNTVTYSSDPEFFVNGNEVIYTSKNLSFHNKKCKYSLPDNYFRFRDNL